MDYKKIKGLDLSYIPDAVEKFYFDGLDGIIITKGKSRTIPAMELPKWVRKSIEQFNKAILKGINHGC